MNASHRTLLSSGSVVFSTTNMHTHTQREGGLGSRPESPALHMPIPLLCPPSTLTRRVRKT